MTDAARSSTTGCPWLIRAHAEIAAKINTGASLEQLPLGKARVLAQFLEDNPGYVAYLNSKQMEFVFRSGSAKNQGGGVYINQTIHMDGLDDESPVTFLRLLAHESGHATLQRLLMPRRTSSASSSPSRSCTSRPKRSTIT